MATKSSPAAPDDFCMLEANNIDDLTTSDGDHTDHVNYEENDTSSDTEFEYVSRPPSVRSFDSPSPSLVSMCNEEVQEVVANVDVLQLTPEPPAPKSPQPRKQLSKPLTTSKLPCHDYTPIGKCTETPYCYHVQPESGPPGSGVLVPPANWPTQPFETWGYPNLPVSNSLHPVIDATGASGKGQSFDHDRFDTQIMALLVENALKSRIEQDMEHDPPNDRILKRQILARLKDLPNTHPVLTEVSRRVGIDLSKPASPPDYHEESQRTATYNEVFTYVEAHALRLLLACHNSLFGRSSCLFSDFSYFIGSHFSSKNLRQSHGEGLELALEIQTSCLLSLDFQDVTEFISPHGQLCGWAREKICSESEKLKVNIDFQAALVEFETNVAGAKTAEEMECMTPTYYQRIAIKDFFNRVLINLNKFDSPCSSYKYDKVDSPSLARPALKREAPRDVEETVEISLPWKRTNIYDTHGRVEEDCQLVASNTDEVIRNQDNTASSLWKPRISRNSSLASEQHVTFGSSPRQDCFVRMLLLKRINDRRRHESTVENNLSKEIDNEVQIGTGTTSPTTNNVFKLPCPTFTCNFSSRDIHDIFRHVRHEHPGFTVMIERIVAGMEERGEIQDEKSIEEIKQWYNDVEGYIRHMAVHQNRDWRKLVVQTERRINELSSLIPVKPTYIRDTLDRVCSSDLAQQKYTLPLMKLELQSLKRQLMIQDENERDLARKLNDFCAKYPAYSRFADMRVQTAVPIMPSFRMRTVSEIQQRNYHLQLTTLEQENLRRLARRRQEDRKVVNSSSDYQRTEGLEPRACEEMIMFQKRIHCGQQREVLDKEEPNSLRHGSLTRCGGAKVDSFPSKDFDSKYVSKEVDQIGKLKISLEQEELSGDNGSNTYPIQTAQTHPASRYISLPIRPARKQQTNDEAKETAVINEKPVETRRRDGDLRKSDGK